MLNEILYDPDCNPEYVSDKILWDNVFLRPFPIDVKRKEMGEIVLGNYFEINDVKLDTNRGYKVNRKLLHPFENYYKVSEEERSNAFIALTNFLCRFNRPYRDYLLHIPNHKSIKEDKSYSPLQIYYRTPVFPRLSESMDMISVRLEPKLYYELCRYSLGENRHLAVNDFVLNFSFSCFCGFILHY